MGTSINDIDSSRQPGHSALGGKKVRPHVSHRVPKILPLASASTKGVPIFVSFIKREKSLNSMSVFPVNGYANDLTVPADIVRHPYLRVWNLP